jgi:hypothetical protein
MTNEVFENGRQCASVCTLLQVLQEITLISVVGSMQLPAVILKLWPKRTAAVHCCIAELTNFTPTMH